MLMTSVRKPLSHHLNWLPGWCAVDCEPNGPSPLPPGAPPPGPRAALTVLPNTTAFLSWADPAAPRPKPAARPSLAAAAARADLASHPTASRPDTAIRPIATSSAARAAVTAVGWPQPAFWASAAATSGALCPSVPTACGWPQPAFWALAAAAAAAAGRADPAIFAIADRPKPAFDFSLPATAARPGAEPAFWATAAAAWRSHAARLAVEPCATPAPAGVCRLRRPRHYVHLRYSTPERCQVGQCTVLKCPEDEALYLITLSLTSLTFERCLHAGYMLCWT